LHPAGLGACRHDASDYPAALGDGDLLPVRDHLEHCGQIVLYLPHGRRLHVRHHVLRPGERQELETVAAPSRASPSNLAIPPTEFGEAGLPSTVVLPLTTKIVRGDVFPLRVRIPAGVRRCRSP
jgi:hypothetical protein